MQKKKTKGEKALKLNNKRVQIFLLILLLLPVLSLFASIGNRFSEVEDDVPSIEEDLTPDKPNIPDEPEAPTCEHRDADDNGVCDKCDAEYSDGEDVVEPEEPEEPDEPQEPDEPDVDGPTLDDSLGTETPIIEVEPDGEWIFN